MCAPLIMAGCPPDTRSGVRRAVRTRASWSLGARTAAVGDLGANDQPIIVLHFDPSNHNVRLMYIKRKKHQLAAVMAAATVGVLAAGPLYSGSASAENCKPPPPITHLAETAIAGRTEDGGGPLRRRGSCPRIGEGGITVKLATSSGRVIQTYHTRAGGVYRFAVRPGLYVVAAYRNAGETNPPCQSKTVRVRRHERKIVNLGVGCDVP